MKIQLKPKRIKGSRKNKGFTKKIGLPPGSLLYTGDKSGEVSVELIEYNQNENSVKPIKKLGSAKWMFRF